MSSRTIILARHGNTFAAGEVPVWVGANQDLALVESGRDQALAVAKELRHRDQIPVQIICGPLKRTHEFARIISSELSLPQVPLVDHRLNEIDFGVWSGKTNEEISALYGHEILMNWDKRGMWPHHAGWVTQYPEFVAQVHDLVREIIWSKSSDGPVLFVTSNGRLRYFLSLVHSAFHERASNGTLKVKTGALSELNWNGKEFEIVNWNISPSLNI